MAKVTNTKPPSGFMELLPAEQIAFDKMKANIQSAYEKFGFVPLDTPAIERAEILFAKGAGETEKQIYRIDKGGTTDELALRFDLTVPLARYVCENMNNLTFPFRRYAIGKVWRGERSQSGRFREFYQCDIDIIGREKLDVLNDAEIIGTINEVFKTLDIGKYTIQINSRKILNGFFEALELSEKSGDILRTIDKLDKIGENKVAEILTDYTDKEKIGKIMEFVKIKGEPSKVFTEIDKLEIKSALFAEGVEELKKISAYAEEMGVKDNNLAINLSIARGLDYYTGTIFETTLNKYPELGSICSGGRYDNLAEYYTEKKLPGVGISIGLTRLFDQLKKAGLINLEQKTVSRILVASMTKDLKVPLEIAGKLRAGGINTELSLSDEKLSKKLDYANKLGIPFVLIVGDNEIKSGLFSLKNMRSGEQKELSADKLTEAIK